MSLAQGLAVIQLPVPGSTLDGQPVTEQTSRRATIEPISTALLKLPAGSVALAALNSENIFAILNRPGVPVAAGDKSCTPGSVCVPCADKAATPALNSTISGISSANRVALSHLHLSSFATLQAGKLPNAECPGFREFRAHNLCFC